MYGDRYEMSGIFSIQGSMYSGFLSHHTIAPYWYIACISKPAFTQVLGAVPTRAHVLQYMGTAVLILGQVYATQK